MLKDDISERLIELVREIVVCTMLHTVHDNIEHPPPVCFSSSSVVIESGNLAKQQSNRLLHGIILIVREAFT